MNYKSWTYKQYLAIYEACNGITTRFIPGTGIRTRSYDKLSQQEFDEKLALSLEIGLRDVNWYLEHYPESYVDDSECGAWELLELQSELFLTEYKRASKTWKAVHGDRTQQEEKAEQWLRENKGAEIIFRGREQRGVRAYIQDIYGKTICSGVATSIGEAIHSVYITLELEDQA